MAKRGKGIPARRPRKKERNGFYSTILSEAERVLLSQAQEAEGLDEEIALLRLRLKNHLEEHPDDLSLLLRGMETLVKMVGANYRLSKKSRDDLSEAIHGVLTGVGDALWPEDLRGA
ncbi:MAG: hypothetical protein V3U90_01295 [Dehalococcoidia bacterium]